MDLLGRLLPGALLRFTEPTSSGELTDTALQTFLFKTYLVSPLVVVIGLIPQSTHYK